MSFPSIGQLKETNEVTFELQTKDTLLDSLIKEFGTNLYVCSGENELLESHNNSLDDTMEELDACIESTFVDFENVIQLKVEYEMSELELQSQMPSNDEESQNQGALLSFLKNELQELEANLESNNMAQEVRSLESKLERAQTEADLLATNIVTITRDRKREDLNMRERLHRAIVEMILIRKEMNDLYQRSMTLKEQHDQLAVENKELQTKVKELDRQQFRSRFFGAGDSEYKSFPDFSYEVGEEYQETDSDTIENSRQQSPVKPNYQKFCMTKSVSFKERQEVKKASPKITVPEKPTPVVKTPVKGTTKSSPMTTVKTPKKPPKTSPPPKDNPKNKSPVVRKSPRIAKKRISPGKKKETTIPTTQTVVEVHVEKTPAEATCSSMDVIDSSPTKSSTFNDQSMVDLDQEFETFDSVSTLGEEEIVKSPDMNFNESFFGVGSDTNAADDSWF